MEQPPPSRELPELPEPPELQEPMIFFSFFFNFHMIDLKLSFSSSSAGCFWQCLYQFSKILFHPFLIASANDPGQFHKASFPSNRVVS